MESGFEPEQPWPLYQRLHTLIQGLPNLPSLLAYLSQLLTAAHVGGLFSLPQSDPGIKKEGVDNGRGWSCPAIALTLLVTKLPRVP